MSPVNGDEPIGIAADGSLYKHHPRLKNWIEHYTDLLVIRPPRRDNQKNGSKANGQNGVHGKYLTVDENDFTGNSQGGGYQTDFFLTLAEDGSGKGAAMSAAIAKRLRDEGVVHG